MTPLEIFDHVIVCFGKKPFEFWPDFEHAKLIKDLKSAILKLKTSLESKDLQDTHAYKIILNLEKDILEKTINEVPFIQHIFNLVEIYRLAPLTEELHGLISTLESHINATKIKLFEHHLSIENLERKSKKLSEEQRRKSDLDTIKKVGVFYVLEYTLQVLWEFQTLSDEDKMKLLKDGIKTKAGNLPSYLSLEDTFRKELCYKIFDDLTRTKLLSSFFCLEDTFCDGIINLKKFTTALKGFNLSLLDAFKNRGYEVFVASIYTPFGSGLSTRDLIKKVEALSI